MPKLRFAPVLGGPPASRDEVRPCSGRLSPRTSLSLARRAAAAFIALGFALLLVAPSPAHAAAWTYTDVVTPGGTPMSVSSVRFNGSLYTTYRGAAAPWRPHILKHQAGGGLQVGDQLPGLCSTGSPAATAATSAIVAYGQLHVFSQKVTLTDLCHAWSPDGATYYHEYLSGGTSTAFGIATAEWAGQLHVVAGGVDGGVQHTWYDPVAGAWLSEKLDEPASTDDMSPVSQARIGVYNGQFHVVYMTTTGTLRDRWWDPATARWNTTTTFGTGSLTGNVTAGMDVETTYSGQFHITYRDATNNMKHAWYDPAAGRWNVETVTAPGSAPLEIGTRIRAFVYSGQFHLLYSPTGYDALAHLWWDPVTGRWLFEDLDAGGSDPDTGLDVVLYDATLDIISNNATYDGLRLLRYR